MPTLIDRTDEFSAGPLVRKTNLTHREWIYRMAFETGRHIIGYEVDKVRAAVDWFTRPGEPKRAILVIGHGEGGMIALYAAAVDTRIDGRCCQRLLRPREGVWQEPLYRNVWGLLEEFGDAEIGSLIAPRTLEIQICPGPEIAGPPPAPPKGRNTAAPGRLTTPSREAVEGEIKRLMGLRIPGEKNLKISSVDAQVTPVNLTDARPHFDPRARMKRQVDQLVDYTQAVIRTSELRRYAYWAKADSSSPREMGRDDRALSHGIP